VTETFFFFQQSFYAATLIEWC